MPITDHDRDELRVAKKLLEKPNLAIRMANLLGYPIERGLALLPPAWAEPIQQVTRRALMQSLRAAISTLEREARVVPSNHLHRGLVAATGAMSGLIGLPALLVELPISTTIILRSIADIARSEGEDLQALESRMACLEVFALGGRTSADEAAEVGYFAVRAALARSVSEAATYLAERGLAEEGAPVLVRLISAIAARFQAVVSQKIIAQTVPVVGAIGGAAVNTIFIDHFQDIARGHFAIRRLERAHGVVAVRAAYAELTF